MGVEPMMYTYSEFIIKKEACLEWTNQQEARNNINDEDLAKLVKDPEKLNQIRSP